MTKADVISKTEVQTAAFAAEMAKISKAGDVWALHGTLGAGKSVFARAFIKSLTAASEVPSPTFTLVQMYDAPEFEIYHYDLYRLEKPEDIYELDAEEAFYSGVSLVEWPERMGSLAPRGMWNLTIEPDGDKRRITVATDSADKAERLEKWLKTQK